MDSSSPPVVDQAAQVLLGRVSGVTRVSLFSYRAIGAQLNSISAGKDIWGGVDDTMTFATANESWEIVSTSALDVVGSSGAEAVQITPLSFSYVQIPAFNVNLNGQTPVVLPSGAAYGWLNSAVTVGINNAAQRRRNQGDLIIRVAGSAGDNTKVRGIIPAFQGGLTQAIYTAPVNATTLIRSLECQILSSAGGGNTRGADFLIMFRNPNGNITAPRRIGTTDVQPYPLDARTWIRVPSRTTFIVQCIYTSAANMTVSVSYEAHTYTL